MGIKRLRGELIGKLRHEAVAWRIEAAPNYFVTLRATQYTEAISPRSLETTFATDITADFWQATQELLEAALPSGTIARGIRLVGMGVTGIEKPRPF